MFLYTLKVFETPFHEPTLGQYLDRDLALKVADEALPHCVGTVVVEKWLIAERNALALPLKDDYVGGVKCERIFKKNGTRKLTESQREAHLFSFI